MLIFLGRWETLLHKCSELEERIYCKKVLCALRVVWGLECYGGTSTCAIGENLLCVFCGYGLVAKGEPEMVGTVFLIIFI
jgi:GMP synthase PP-ATPase subunit